MSAFKREERYIVVKLKHLAGLQVAPLRNFLRENRVPTLDCVVIESDWPEYEPVWKMIERRMAGQPAVTAAEELDAVLHWRNKHAVAVKERDALQQLLNAADELSVTSILLDVVPGDGSGHEVYAKSVDEVVNALSAMGDKIEDLEGELVTLRALLDAPPRQNFTKIEMAHVFNALEDVRGKPVLTSNQCHDLARALNDRLLSPLQLLSLPPDYLAAAQPQGEPIYQARFESGYAGWRDVDVGTYEVLKGDERYQSRVVYAEQPAPVAFPGYPPVPEDRKLPVPVAFTGFDPGSPGGDLGCEVEGVLQPDGKLRIDKITHIESDGSYWQTHNPIFKTWNDCTQEEARQFKKRGFFVRRIDLEAQP